MHNYAQHGPNSRLKTPQAPTLTHEQIMLAFAQDVLKYEQAQLNIHFAWIGLTHPCPCNDCRGIVHEFDGFAAIARQIVRADLEKQGEQAAAKMLAVAKEQQAKFVSPIPDHDRINAAANADLALIETFEKMRDEAIKTGEKRVALVQHG